MYVTLGTGFSYAEKSGYDSDEAEVGEDMYQFLQLFFQNSTWKDNDLYIFGESYGGHFVPATTHRVWQGNQARAEAAQQVQEEAAGTRSDSKSDGALFLSGQGEHINLKGMAIGNGLTNPEVQYTAFPEYVMIYIYIYVYLFSDDPFIIIL